MTMMRGHGALEPLFNLECSEHHRWYAPKPSKWYGHSCGAVVDGSKRCQRKLRRLKQQ